MCACEPGFTCAACRDTRLDDRYLENEPRQDEDVPFYELERDPRA